jgi:hypothetical protein
MGGESGYGERRTKSLISLNGWRRKFGIFRSRNKANTPTLSLETREQQGWGNLKFFVSGKERASPRGGIRHADLQLRERRLHYGLGDTINLPLRFDLRFDLVPSLLAAH